MTSFAKRPGTTKSSSLVPRPWEASLDRPFGLISVVRATSRPISPNMYRYRAYCVHWSLNIRIRSTILDWNRKGEKNNEENNLKPL